MYVKKLVKPKGMLHGRDGGLLLHTTSRFAPPFARFRTAVYSENGLLARATAPLPASLFEKPQRQSHRMAVDVSKHLDRAKRFLEKNRVEDAIAAYKAVLDEAPQHQEATQALGDLYARADQPDRAGVYYGLLFDMLIEPRDESKALAIFNRFLRSGAPQPPERIARYAFLQQKQNKNDEAMEQYSKAADLFVEAGRQEDALFCLERTAQLDPENLKRQLRVAEVAERLGKNAVAAKAFLRTGQLATSAGTPEEALRFFERAHKLAPQERSVALLYAEATLRGGDAKKAASLLEPFAAADSDATFLETFADALMRSGKPDRAREILERLLKEKNQGVPRLFDLVDAYAQAGQDSKSVDVLKLTKDRMYADRKQNDFIAQLDGVGAKHPNSQAILEFCGAFYSEANRETQYFEILIKLFDVYLNAGNVQKATEALEKSVDIDPYDNRNQERLQKLHGRVDESLLRRLGGRLTKSGTSAPPRTVRAQSSTADSVSSSSPSATGEPRQLQALEDLIVQTEIFLQYSLQNKALERLQKIAATFPGEEERNTRLRNLYQTANWWPGGVARPKAEPVVTARPVEPVPELLGANITQKTGVYTAETLRDLAKISEINQKIFRQQTPRAMLNTAVNEVGAYLHCSRALAVFGAAGRPPEMAAEFCAAGVRATPGAQVVLLLSQMEKSQPDELGGLTLNVANTAILKEMGISTALGVSLNDKETQSPAGMLIVAHAEAYKWKPNEAYFLQAIGDQMLMSVSHTRLRSLVRRMGVSDERTGLLSRSSYQSCLLTEADRSRTQGTPLSLAILQIDRGAEILRQQGESPVERFLEQLARSLQPIVRQNDVAVKYTSWSLAFILPDTTLAGAQNLADKLRRAASGLRPPWDSGQVSLSAGIVEAVAKADFENEDIVTDLINRAETSVEEARKRGGDTVVALESPKL
jgi:diguanylate cyclase (GGDEF)-like protein